MKKNIIFLLASSIILLGCTANDGKLLRSMMPEIADTLQTTGINTNNDSMTQSGMVLEAIHEALPENTSSEDINSSASDPDPSEHSLILTASAENTRITLPSSILQKASCNGDLSFLSPLLPNYQDSNLNSVRDIILNSSISDAIQAAKSQGYTKSEALISLEQQAIEHDNTAAEAASSADNTQGAGSAIERAKNDTLSLNFTCEGVYNSSVCAFIMNRWGSLGSRASGALFSKCW
ncbi:hypothetical protein [Aeromonas sp. 3P]|uniref:hypothetical protein n=1 Tax=unclassified Aeromonas TaxID=257493 RepID=UPI003F79BE46